MSAWHELSLSTGSKEQSQRGEITISAPTIDVLRVRRLITVELVRLSSPSRAEFREKNARLSLSACKLRREKDRVNVDTYDCPVVNITSLRGGRTIPGRCATSRRDHRRSIAASTAPRLTHVKHACVRAYVRA